MRVVRVCVWCNGLTQSQKKKQQNCVSCAGAASFLAEVFACVPRHSRATRQHRDVITRATRQIPATSSSQSDAGDKSSSRMTRKSATLFIL